jgi:LPS export ABC transporter protein LptC
MMTGFRNILWLLPVGLVLSWPLWGGSITRLLVPRSGLPVTLAAPPQATTTGAGFSMEGVSFSQLKNGVRDWEIEAKRLHAGEDQDRMQLEAVAAQVFKGAERTFVITGQEGEYNSKEKVIAMRNGVKVQAEDGFQVQSDSLSFNEQTRKIITTEPVQITGKGMDVRGQGMIYDMEKDSYDIRGRVKVDIR